MLRSVGCSYVILGHSERRQYFGETDASVNAKTAQAMRRGLIPIVCVGETLEERDAGQERSVVGRQIDGALADIVPESAATLVLAYEPVWAIGTGRTATPEQAGDMHSFIRERLVERLGDAVGSDVQILYGGSMKPENADELLARPHVNGGLIGGAALNADAFAAIVAAAVRAAG
jgi:triosephosphate isomerase